MAEVNYQNLREKAYAIIKEKIVNCEFLPGTPLSESKLISEIGASRTPIREALNRLEHENLVRIYPQRGVFVTDVSVKDVINIYTVREVVEPLAARLAAPHIDLDALRYYYEIFSDDGAVYSLTDHFRIDRGFHSLIANSTDNDYLAKILLGLYDQNSRTRILSKIRVKERQQEARLEHLEIARCLMERDADKAEEAMRKHIINGRNTALKITT